MLELLEPTRENAVISRCNDAAHRITIADAMASVANSDADNTVLLSHWLKLMVDHDKQCTNEMLIEVAHDRKLKPGLNLGKPMHDFESFLSTARSNEEGFKKFLHSIGVAFKEDEQESLSDGVDVEFSNA
jgi:hypothetical protein